MLPTVHGPELIIILVIILLLFGAKRIPELAKGLGTGVREFRRGTRSGDEVEDKDEEKKGEELTAAEKDDPEPRAQEDGDSSSTEADRAEQKPS
ncbi:MAG TPA: twin-arginine translocase TatA/TatE family subunit [Rubrobacteraceae bacterium]|jgi:sec-independent protein translocase protein TatA|nr:twin-arginine translocase TatA/TatE family subunit [Rubrobacteraceae bacterium]